MKLNEKRLKLLMSLLLTFSMLFSISGMFTVSAEITNLSYAAANFDDATTPEGTYNSMTLAHTPQKGNKVGKLSLIEEATPYYGKMLRYEQPNTGTGLQFMDFTLTEGLKIGDSVPENSYAEISADVRLENKTTGINIDFANKNHTGNSFMFRASIRNNGALYLNNTLNVATVTSQSNGVFNNIRIKVDLHNKNIVGIYIDDELLVDLSVSTIALTNAGVETIDRLKISVGKETVTDTLYIDNVSVVTYISTDGTSPVASKAVLRDLLDETDVESLTDAQKAIFENAVSMAKNPIATQSEVDGMVGELKAFSDVTPDIPQIPSNEPFTMSENFESQLSESDYEITYGEGIITQEIFDDVPYGNNILKIKTDTSKKNVNQYVDFGLGNKKIDFEKEEPNCYVEFGIDFSCYNMSKYGKNIFVYFRDSSDTNMGYLYITGGRAIRIAGLVDGEIILSSIEEQETTMNNVRIVMQMTDGDGNASQKITAIYADDVLLNANYPLQMKTATEFAKMRVMISNIKDEDFGLGKEWATNIDNMTVTKYYSESGETTLYTKGQLVSLMRGYNKEATSKHKDKIYSDEDFYEAQEAINSAAAIYMNPESSDADIDAAYRNLYFAKIRVEIPEGASFDVGDVSTTGEKLNGNSEIKVNLSVVTAKKLAEVISPVFVGVLMKNEENADKLLDTVVASESIEPASNKDINLTFDLSAYSEEEKEDMYIKIFAFEDISQMKLANIDMPILFGDEGTVDNELYRYSDKGYAYQIVEEDDDVISVFTKTGERYEENLLLLFEKNFDISDFDTEEIKDKLIFAYTSEVDKNGKSAIAVKGIPTGEYVYYLAGNKGRFISSDKETIENALGEVCENSEKIDDFYAILGIDEESYNEVKDNGVNPADVLGEMLANNSYDILKLQEFAEDLMDNLWMLNDFKNIKTVDYVREAMKEYSGRISNVSNYNSLDTRKKNIAEEYILENKDRITSIDALEDLIESAVEKAKKHNISGSSGSSGGGGGGGNSRPSGTVIASPNSANNKKEYGDIVEVHSGEFTDLENFEWAKPAVALLAKKGSVAGKAKGIFAPSDMVTRGEFVKMLLLTFDYKIEELGSTFSDVADDSWYKPYVMTAAKSGIVTGYSEEFFGAQELISRQDATVIIARVLKNLNVGFSENGEYIPFVDEELIADYAKDAVFCMGKCGIVNGVSGNYFAPKENATRAEAAKLIYEAYMFMATKEG